MTRNEFESRLIGIGINQTTFALLTGLDRGTVYAWGNERKPGPGRRERAPVPSWVPVLLETWEAAPRVLARLVRRLRAGGDAGGPST